MLESGVEKGDNRMMEQLQAKLEYEDIKKLMDKENPIISKVYHPCNNQTIFHFQSFALPKFLLNSL